MATGRPCSAHRLACSRAACGSFVHLDPVRQDKSGAARRVLSWPSLTPVTGTAKAAAPCIPSVSTSPLDLGQRHPPDPSLNGCRWEPLCVPNLVEADPGCVVLQGRTAVAIIQPSKRRRSASVHRQLSDAESLQIISAAGQRECSVDALWPLSAR